MRFGLEDLFVAGLGLDIAGATILARGLLQSPSHIAVLTGTYLGYNTWQTVSRAQDRVDGTFGLAALLLGFGVQAVGYGAAVAGLEEASGTSASFIAVACGIATAAVTFAVSWTVRRKRVKRLLIQIALAAPDTQQQLGVGEGRWTRERASRLLGLGQALGYPVLPEDDPENTKVLYIQRVFGIDLSKEPI